MTPREIEVGTVFRFAGRLCRCTEINHDFEGRVITYDILSDDLFNDVIGWSFYQFWPIELDKDINIRVSKEQEQDMYEDDFDD